MAIPFLANPGGYFPRLGRLGAWINNAYAYQQTQLQAFINTSTGAVAQYNAESDIQALVGDNYINMMTGPENVASLAQQIAQATTNRMVYRSLAQVNQNLTQANILASIGQVITGMRAGGFAVQAMTIGITPAAFTGQGNGVVVGSAKRPFDGLILENSFQEQVKFLCTQDSYSGGATAGNEGFTVTGQGSEPDLFAFDWPLGSNGSGAYSAINGDASNSQGNVLTNSGFASWTVPNVPDDFTVVTGTPGTNVFKETTLTYTGPAALKILGDGATNVDVRQQFNAGATGTAGTLSAQTQYGFNVFLRGNASPPGAGVLTVQLVDQNGAVINDAAGVPNTFAFNLVSGSTALNATYTSYSGVFRTPAILSAQQWLRFYLSTPLTNTYPLYLGKMAFGALQQLYVSGPYFAVFSGSAPFFQGDVAYCEVTNSRNNSQAQLFSWQPTLMRLLDPFVISNEFLFPSLLIGANVPDSLIA